MVDIADMLRKMGRSDVVEPVYPAETAPERLDRMRLVRYTAPVNPERASQWGGPILEGD